jgi:hypothetical protein
MLRLTYKKENTFIVTDFDEYGLVKTYKIIRSNVNDLLIEVEYVPFNRKKITDVFSDANLLQEKRPINETRKINLFNVKRVIPAHNPEIFKEAARRSYFTSNTLVTLYAMFPLWLEKDGHKKCGFLDSVLANADIEDAKKIFLAYAEDIYPCPPTI